MVAHNKNYKSGPTQLPPQPHKPPRAKPRWAEHKDAVSPFSESDLICELADPSNSLEDICAVRHISLETLSLWMARPDVAQRLDLVQTTAMNRARFIGRLTLPTAAQSAANIINAHKLRPQKPTIDSAFNTELHRANENMLKAARFLQRLTAEPAPISRRRHSEAPSLREGVGEGRKEPGEGAAPSTVHFDTESNTDAAARELPELNQRDQSLPLDTRRNSTRRKRRNSPPRSTKARPRKPSRPSTQSRITASSTPTPSIAASISPQPNQAATRRAPENSAPPPRARAPSPASRAASG